MDVGLQLFYKAPCRPQASFSREINLPQGSPSQHPHPFPAGLVGEITVARESVCGERTQPLGQHRQRIQLWDGLRQAEDLGNTPRPRHLLAGG